MSRIKWLEKLSDITTHYNLIQIEAVESRQERYLNVKCLKARLSQWCRSTGKWATGFSSSLLSGNLNGIMKKNLVLRWYLGYEQTFPLMLWDNKSFFGAEEVPQDSSKLFFFPRRRERVAHPCRATPSLGTPLTRAAQQHQHQHLNSEALRPLHGQLWKNINYKSSTSWPFCLFRPPASGERWTTPAVLPASPK